MKVDVSGWGKFKVGELFGGVRGKTKRMQILEDGDTPLIAAARSNRGIAGTYNIDAECENCITVSCNGVGCGSTFYHNYPFSITGDAIVLEEKLYMSDYTKQFIASIIDVSFSNKYSYEEKCSADKALNETILLPATPSGEPDWEYMENYMREMEAKAKERLQKLEELRRQKKRKIDVSGWGEFKVGELFDVAISKSMNKTFLNFVEDGEIEYIGRTSINNGVQGKMNICDNIEPNPKNVFSLAQIGENVCLFRKMPWYSSQNIFILAPKKEDLLRAEKYISTIITKTMDSVYGNDAYSSYPTLKTLKKVTILLPATPAGEPDWEYMENYMREMEMKTKVRLDKLKLEFS